MSGVSRSSKSIKKPPSPIASQSVATWLGLGVGEGLAREKPPSPIASQRVATLAENKGVHAWVAT